jgi:hypothetical protein
MFKVMRQVKGKAEKLVMLIMIQMNRYLKDPHLMAQIGNPLNRNSDQV